MESEKRSESSDSRVPIRKQRRTTDESHAAGIRRRELLTVLGSEVIAGGALALGATRTISESALETEDRVALALMHFRTGFHCSQSVLAAYADDLGIDEELALRIAAGLAGGSTVGGECGAVGAGYIILALKHARLEPSFGDTSREEELFGRIRRFVAEFRRRHGSINCLELLGADVCTSKGRRKALEDHLFTTRCPHYLRDAIEILDSLG
jgi:C_GCAxxG_C_C family probable redox protein